MEARRAMNEARSQSRTAGGMNPQALRLDDAARVLSAVSPRPVTAEMLQTDIDAGAPTNADGTINLVHFAAWLVSEVTRGD